MVDEEPYLHVWQQFGLRVIAVEFMFTDALTSHTQSMVILLGSIGEHSTRAGIWEGGSQNQAVNSVTTTSGGLHTHHRGR